MNEKLLWLKHMLSESKSVIIAMTPNREMKLQIRTARSTWRTADVYQIGTVSSGSI